MKKFSLVLVAFSLLFILLSPYVSAQSDPRVDKKMAGMHEIFELTDEQSAQIRAVFTTTATQLDKIRPLRQSDRNAFRRQRQQIMQNMETGVAAALDEAQAAQFSQMLAEYRARRRAAVSGAAGTEVSDQEEVEAPLPQVGEISTENATEVSNMTMENEVVVEENSENAPETSSKNEWLEKTLDFLYEDILMPAVRKKNN
ncbi:MAG: hypothetical protein R3C61_18370 [Bacteroidia bacterium]